MKKVNLRELYPDIYKTDVFIEVSSEVQEVFLTDKHLNEKLNSGFGPNARVNSI